MRKNLTHPLAALGLMAVIAGCGTTGVTGAVGAAKAKVSSLYASAADAPKSIVTIRFKDAAQLEAVSRAGVDLFENVDHDKRTVGASLSARTEATLKKMGVSYTAMLGAERMHAMGFPTGYQTIDQVNADIKSLADKHPGFMKLVQIGNSLEGRPVYGVRITSKPDTGLPAVRLQSGMHARELPTIELTSRLVHQLAEGYGKDQTITRLVDTRDIWVVLAANPDGRHKVQEGNDMWRKNTHKFSGATGVDINRNADDHFDQGDNSKHSDAYRGEAPFSEPETQAIRDLANKMKFKVSLDVHCYGGMVLWPPGYTTEVSKDEAAFAAIGNKLAGPIGYKRGTIARTIYKTFGDFATWEYTQHGTLAFAAELNSGGFSVPFAQVDKAWKEWQPNFMYLIDVAGNKNAEHPATANFFSFGKF